MGSAWLARVRLESQRTSCWKRIPGSRTAGRTSQSRLNQQNASHHHDSCLARLRSRTLTSALKVVFERDCDEMAIRARLQVQSAASIGYRSQRFASEVDHRMCRT